jgi:hypothetical protein
MAVDVDAGHGELIDAEPWPVSGVRPALLVGLVAVVALAGLVGWDLLGRRWNGRRAGIACGLRVRRVDVATCRRGHHRCIDPRPRVRGDLREADDVGALSGAAQLTSLSLLDTQEIVHLGDLSLLSDDDHLCQLPGIRTLPMGDLRLRHRHRALVVVNHRCHPQLVESGAAQ